ncbi:GLPGLI family protein [Psychroflexus sp. CAK8W]|uniref:GLPGLI family protein n=1 Tax=Psychroflexus longus TaxID=2873596 RepID=A0ABS7XLH4_9FLAO|nr:GLPGLI family protein [Psychroflexus longus]MBZ9779254.1 GLPGLI family protein [Psychroflexus longus]
MKYLLILLICFTANAQTSGLVNYKSKIFSQVIDTTEIKDDKIKKSMLQTVQKMKKQMPYASYVLKFNSNESIFKIAKKMTVDEIIDYNLIAGFSDADGEFFNSKNKKIRLRKLKAWNNEYIIRSNFPEWKISNQKKDVLGYQCLKATTEKELDNGDIIEVVAWFAKDIPFNFGPKEYAGLPGLILEIEERGIKFYATEIDLNNKKHNIKLPDVKKSITKKEFLSQSPYK